MLTKTAFLADLISLIPPRGKSRGILLSVKSNLFSVGVTMGRNENEISISSNALKHMEIDRLKVSPKCSSKVSTTQLDDEEAEATYDGQLLSHLVGEISEVGLEETDLGSVYDLKASGRKSKSTSSKKNKAPRKKAKISKSPIVF